MRRVQKVMHTVHIDSPHTPRRILPHEKLRSVNRMSVRNKLTESGEFPGYVDLAAARGHVRQGLPGRGVASVPMT